MMQLFEIALKLNGLFTLLQVEELNPWPDTVGYKRYQVGHDILHIHMDHNERAVYSQYYLFTHADTKLIAKAITDHLLKAA